MLLDELGVALDGVGADAEEEGFLGDLGPGVSYFARYAELRRTGRRAQAWVVQPGVMSFG